VLLVRELHFTKQSGDQDLLYMDRMEQVFFCYSLPAPSLFFRCVKVLYLSRSAPNFYFHPCLSQPRGALALLLNIPGVAGGGKRLMWVVNTHLSHKAISSEHTRQATQLFGWAHRLGQGVLWVCVWKKKETNEKERACEGDLIVCTGVGEEGREYRVYIGESERARVRARV